MWSSAVEASWAAVREGTVVKRALDLAIARTAVVALAPLWLVWAVAVRLSSSAGRRCSGRSAWAGTESPSRFSSSARCESSRAGRR